MKLKKFELEERSCSMITNKNQLLIPAPELAKPGLTCTKYCLRCIDMVYERRSEYDNSIIHTRASNIVYFRLFFVFWPIYKNTNKCVVMAKMVVLYKNKWITISVTLVGHMKDVLYKKICWTTPSFDLMLFKAQ